MSPCTWLQRNEPEQSSNLFVFVTGTFLPAFMPKHDVLGTRLLVLVRLPLSKCQRDSYIQKNNNFAIRHSPKFCATKRCKKVRRHGKGQKFCMRN